MKNIVMIDNFDSFTHNLAYEFEKRNCKVEVLRNNIPLKIIKEKIKELKPRIIVVSPGPGNPAKAGHSSKIIEHYSGKIPVLGICLGHQCIVEVFGGTVVKAKKVMHGKPSRIILKEHYVFAGLGNNLQVGRYHSLIGKAIPDILEVIAETSEGEVMAVSHKKHKLVGIQFHPESILTSEGGKIIENMLGSI